MDVTVKRRAVVEDGSYYDNQVEQSSILMAKRPWSLLTFNTLSK